MESKASLTKPASTIAREGRVQPQRSAVPKNTKELRGFLLEQMTHVADGSQDAMDAKAICNYAQQIYNTVNLEMRHAQAVQKMGDTPIEPVVFGD